MSDFFEESGWSRKEKADLYLANADILIPVRREMARILVSFASRFMGGKGGKLRLLDLGSGDGAMVEGVVNSTDAEVTFVDGSDDMLAAAKERYRAHGDATFLRASFEDIIEGRVEVERPEGGFDLIVSAFAIHHLTTGERQALFKLLAAMSADRGWIINMDTVLAASPELEEWFMELRKEAAKELAGAVEIEGLDDVVEGHKNKAHHERLDTLEVQMNSLEEAGYRSVECFYKFGVFAMYGGQVRRLRTAGRVL